MIRLTKLNEATRAEKDALYAALGGRDADAMMSKLDDILDKLDSAIGDNKMYMDRKEYQKFQTLIFQLTATYEPKKPDAKQIQIAIDSLVKFYKETVNKKTKELLDKLDSEASKMKSKIK
jgi:hypothetical protein